LDDGMDGWKGRPLATAIRCCRRPLPLPSRDEELR
jgi:hypothetical protein